MFKVICILFSFACSTLFAQTNATMKVTNKAIVTKAVAPVYALPFPDSKMTSQVLLSDPLNIIDEQDNYFKVEIPYQVIFNTDHSDWVSFTGWVLKSDIRQVDSFRTPTIMVTAPWADILVSVPIGTKGSQAYLQPVCLGTFLEGVLDDEGFYHVRLPNGRIGSLRADFAKELEIIDDLQKEEIKQGVIKKGLELVGNPYLEGGVSPYRADSATYETATGVDKAGLVALLYRSFLIQVPQNVQDQYLWSYTDPDVLESGDLVFLADPTTEECYHVMLIVDHNTLLEARADSVQQVRTISTADLFGKSLNEITHGEIINGQKIFFGSLFE